MLKLLHCTCMCIYHKRSNRITIENTPKWNMCIFAKTDYVCQRPLSCKWTSAEATRTVSSRSRGVIPIKASPSKWTSRSLASCRHRRRRPNRRCAGMVWTTRRARVWRVVSCLTSHPSPAPHRSPHLKPVRPQRAVVPKMSHSRIVRVSF